MAEEFHLFDPNRSPFRWEAVSRTAGEYGGDYAEAFPLPPSGCVALLSSSSEPGASGAMWMMLTRSVYRLAAMSGKAPSEVLLGTHRLLLRDAPGVSESAACIRVDFPTRKLTIARAGDVHAFLLHAASGVVEPLPGGEWPLGCVEATADVADRETAWEPLDMVVLCGRGVPRVAKGSGEQFGIERLSRAIFTAPRSAKGMAEAVREHIDAHALDAPRVDDVSILVLELREP